MYLERCLGSKVQINIIELVSYKWADCEKIVYMLQTDIVVKTATLSFLDHDLKRKKIKFSVSQISYFLN